MELHIAESEVQSGSVRIRWCVDKQTLKTLDRLKCHEPYLLLVAAPKEHYSRHRESRKIVPLRDLMTYVDCRSAGETVIHGIILHEGTEKEHKNRYLRRDGGSWSTHVLKHDGEAVYEEFDVFVDPRMPPMPDGDPYPGAPGGRSASVGVVIPKECFAKEPPAWEKEWVNLWFRQQPADQCEYRKRRILAYSVQPIAIAAFFTVVGALAYAIAWVVGIWLTLCGVRGVNYKMLLDPRELNKGSGDGPHFGDLDGSWFLPRTKRTWVRFITFPFTPAFPLLAFVIFKFALKKKLMAAILYSFLGAAGIAATVAVIGAVLSLAIAGIIAALDARAEAERKRLEKEPNWYLQDDLLTCDGDGRPMGIGDLPRARRSFRLRFLDLKAKVCRPFAS